jgi:hypothetical protein
MASSVLCDNVGPYLAQLKEALTLYLVLGAVPVALELCAMK